MPGLFGTSQPANSPLAITVSDIAPETILFVLGGEIDLATQPQLQQALTTAIGNAPSHLVLDLTNVTFLGSAGLHLFTELHTTQHVAAYHVALVVGHNRVALRALQITGLDQILDLHTDLATAVHACHQSPKDEHQHPPATVPPWSPSEQGA
jgi:anti-sigma B factor antagonist